MRQRILLTVSAAICLLTSCKKNNDSGNNGNFVHPQIYVEEVKVGPSDQIDSFALSYDGNGRLVSLVGTNEKVTYTYAANGNFTLDLFQNGVQTLHENAYINAALLLDSTFQYNDTQDTTTEKYHYNGSYLTTTMTYDYSGGHPVLDSRDTYTYDNNGNVIKDVNDDGSGNINMTTVYSYTDTPMQFSVNVSAVPVYSKFLPAALTVTDGSGAMSLQVAYTYEFDNSKRLTKQTATASNGEIAIKTYIY
jgi:hypothetical protein